MFTQPFFICNRTDDERCDRALLTVREWQEGVMPEPAISLPRHVERLPDHVCTVAAWQTCLQFARELHGNGFERTYFWDWLNARPLPLGTEALATWRRRKSARSDADADIPVPAPILHAEGNAWAGIVVRREAAGGGIVTLFGCVELIRESPQHREWQYIEPIFCVDGVQGVEIVRGKVVLPKPLQTEKDVLRAWYRKHLLHRRMGRPPGTTSEGPTKDERQAYEEALRSLNPGDRTATNIARKMSRLLDRNVSRGFVWYWMEQDTFPRDPQARTRQSDTDTPPSE